MPYMTIIMFWNSIRIYVTKFTEWSECSKDCGGGLTARSRKVFREPQQDGEACPHLNETEVCNNMTCPFVGMPPIGVSKFQLKNYFLG